MKVFLERAYDVSFSKQNYYVLVDRLWPRGIKKEDLKINSWQKDIAPSTDLRKWFNHDPKKFTEFKKRYKSELKNNTAMDEFIKDIKDKSSVTLLYSAKDKEHNQAVVLKDYLDTFV